MISRLVVRNYKSIRDVDLALGQLAVFVGQNGVGKSNLLDSLRLVSNALRETLENAIQIRGGIDNVRRRAKTRPRHVGIRLEILLPSGKTATYAFTLVPQKGEQYTVSKELCWISGKGFRDGVHYEVAEGSLVESTPELTAAVNPSDLYLRSISGQDGFKELWEYLRSIEVYNPNPDVLRAVQDPNTKPLLDRDTKNLPSVIRRLARQQSDKLGRIIAYMRQIVPGLHDVRWSPSPPKETLVFSQDLGTPNSTGKPSDFFAQSMSDGTLRAVGVLGAAFQEAISVVGVEEPEVALHPGAATVLADALVEVSADKQVLVTTHSPDMLDHLATTTREIFVVGAVDGVTFVEPLNPSLADLIRSELFSPGELLRLGQFQLSESASRTKPVQQELFKGRWR